MKKTLLAITLLSGIWGSTYAQQQKKLKLNIGGELGAPFGRTHHHYKGLSYGARIKGEYEVSPNLFATLSAGYASLERKPIFYDPVFGQQYIDNGVSLNGTQVKMIPVKAGLKYYLTKLFFVEGQAGAGFLTKYGGTVFIYSPGVGITTTRGIELGARYEAWEKRGTIDQAIFSVSYRF